MAGHLRSPDRAPDRSRPGTTPALPADLSVSYAPVRLSVGSVSAQQQGVSGAASADASAVSALPERCGAAGADPLAHTLVDPVVSAESELLASGGSSASEAPAGKMADPCPGIPGGLSGRQRRLDRASVLPEPHHRLLPLVLAGGAPAAGAALAPAPISRAHRRGAAPPGDVCGDPLSCRPLRSPRADGMLCLCPGARRAGAGLVSPAAVSLDTGGSGYPARLSAPRPRSAAAGCSSIPGADDDLSSVLHL